MYIVKVTHDGEVRYLTHGDSFDPRRTEARTFLFRQNAGEVAGHWQARADVTGQVEVEEVRYYGCICGKDFGCKCGYTNSKAERG